MTADPSLGYDPVSVKLSDADIAALRRTTGRKRRGLAARSFVLNANDPAQEILPQSDSRVEAYITSMTNPCIVGSGKGDVLNAGNGNATVQAASVPIPLNTTDSVWASSVTLPTTISVVAFYEQPD